MTGRTTKAFRVGLIAVLSLIILISLGWVNYTYAQSHPGGVDFMTHWVAARAALRGVSPYNPDVAIEVQTRFYGRPAVVGENEFLIVYPLYYIVQYLPFGFINDLTLARGIWMTLAEIILIIMALLSARAVDWKISRKLMPVYLIFSLFWYESLRAVINGNIVLLVSFWLVLTAFLIQGRKDVLAGVALVMATSKPNLALLPVLWICIWALFTRRWSLLKGFFGSLVIFVLMGTAFFPKWLIQLPNLVLHYPSYNPPTNPGMVLELWFPTIGNWLGLIITLIVTVILLWAWSKYRQADYQAFLWVYCLTLVVSQWSGITTDPGNFLILFLPLVLILAGLGNVFGEGGVYAALAVLFFGLWTLFLVTYTIDSAGQPMQSPLLFFPLPLILLVGLFALQRQVAGKAEKE